MHKIQAKEFTWNDFSIDKLFMEEDVYNWVEPMDKIIEALNAAREKFLETKDKKYWWQMIQLLPTSYNQKRTITMDYETLLNIYETRKNHRLDEWNTFREWIKSLPYTKDLFEKES